MNEEYLQLVLVRYGSDKDRKVFGNEQAACAYAGKQAAKTQT